MQHALSLMISRPRRAGQQGRQAIHLQEELIDHETVHLAHHTLNCFSHCQAAQHTYTSRRSLCISSSCAPHGTAE